MKTKSQSPGISLAFLDIMSCGFGAFILLFLIIKHNYDAVVDLPQDYLEEEIESLKIQNNAVLKKFQSSSQEESALNQKLLTIQKNLSAKKNEQTEREKLISEWDLKKFKSLDKLKFELNKAKEKQLSLQYAQMNQPKDTLKFIGQGEREYLSGIKSGGNNILILLDISASMLDEKIVNILRRRNIEGTKRINSKKWQQAVSTVEWIGARLPLASKYQIMVYNETCNSLTRKNERSWLMTSNIGELESTIQETKNIRPEGGTNLYNAFMALKRLEPPPDNVYLITDGLPTVGKNTTEDINVSGEMRLRLFEEAAKILPKNIPINIVLLPMEGDPLAAWAYWGIASVTKGSFLSPASDWP